MFGIGPQELLVIMIVGLLVLGPKRLPEIARSLGRGMAEFRRASSDLRQSLSLEDEPARRAPPPRTPAQAGVGADPIDEDSDETDPQPGVPIDGDSAAGEGVTSDPAEGRTIAEPGHEDAADPEDRLDWTGPPDKKTPSGG